MKTSSQDTTFEAEQKQFELVRNLSHAKRAELAVSLTNTLRRLIVADLKLRFPTAHNDEIRRRFIARVLTRADVIRAYGFDPEEEGY
jgi:hypothetical protein